MRFPPSFLDEIRDRVPISTLIGTRVSFDRKKTNAAKGDYWACCPFHGEKTPSFHCEDRKGRYHCFGCGVTGDHFKFLTDLEGLNFPEAVQRVADMAGVPMPARDPEMEKREAERATLHDVMNMAAQFFEQQLQAAAGAKARAYLRDRGLSTSTQQAFRLGYAPESRNALKEYLAGKGATREQIEACGLVYSGEGIAVSYDRFRDRIMFPIEDTRGRVIAFGGRALSPDAPAKYLNSPETELFHKGRMLYNALRARKACQPQGGEPAKAVIAVEGYMDVIALAQAGFAQAVAPLGTALTEDQLELLWRVSPEPVLCFDGDQAGIRAAHRAVDLGLPALKPGKSLRFALLPEGKDPDDLVKADGPQAFQAVLRDARPLADMLWTRETASGVFDTPERRAELEARLREITGRIGEENVRRHYAQEMRDRAQQFFGQARQGNQRGNQRGNNRNGYGQGGYGQGGYGQGAYGQRGRGAASGRLAVSESLARSSLVKSASSTSTPPLRETAILLILLNHPRLIEEDFEAMAALDLEHPQLRRMHLAMLDAMAAAHLQDGVEMRQALRAAGHGEMIETLEGIVRRARVWTATERAAEEDAREALRQAVHLHQRARTLHKELRAVEAALMDDETGDVFGRLVDIQNEIRKAEATEALIEGFGIPSGRPAGGF
ncbi:DNA primase [Phyllobacterium phragmitis]|uniref:DNA primase n=2 Tax=Phyllobacterium phragmitis TaxID=2670329 RepID=A0A2S9IXI7_9HYPH|nr:DNA primase [Phyllobacterium phragmitis]PRD45237.1 DNA primase [Phyllobacterium phragmitis]